MESFGFLAGEGDLEWDLERERDLECDRAGDLERERECLGERDLDLDNELKRELLLPLDRLSLEMDLDRDLDLDVALALGRGDRDLDREKSRDRRPEDRDLERECDRDLDLDLDREIVEARESRRPEAVSFCLVEPLRATGGRGDHDRERRWRLLWSENRFESKGAAFLASVILSAHCRFSLRKSSLPLTSLWSSSCVPLPDASQEVRFWPMLLLHACACSFQLGTNLSGKLLRRLLFMSLKEDASSRARKGGDVFQLFLACCSSSRVNGEDAESMSSKLMRCPPQSDEVRLLRGRLEIGDCCSAALAFCSLNTAAALKDVAAPVML